MFAKWRRRSRIKKMKRTFKTGTKLAAAVIIAGALFTFGSDLYHTAKSGITEVTTKAVLMANQY